jgi:hypothetical protein
MTLEATATPDTGAAPETGGEASFQNIWDKTVEAEKPKLDNQQVEGQDTEVPPPAWTSFDDFVKAAQADPEQVRTLPVTVKIDGQEKQVPLAEVLKSYQLEQHVNQKSMAVSQEKTTFEAERQASRTLMAQQVQQAAQLGTIAQQMINQDYARINWDALRVQNPAEFAALQQDFQQRQQQVAQFQQAVSQRQAIEAAQQQQEQQAGLVRERERLLAARPEWRDEAKFAPERESMIKYGRTVGFSDAEMGALMDHRYMLVLHDAARFAQLQASAPEMVKRVRQAPQMAAPGARKTQAPGQAQRQAAIERFNKNPKDQDAQAAVFDFLVRAGT